MTQKWNVKDLKRLADENHKAMLAMVNAIAETKQDPNKDPTISSEDYNDVVNTLVTVATSMVEDSNLQIGIMEEMESRVRFHGDDKSIHYYLTKESMKGLINASAKALDAIAFNDTSKKDEIVKDLSDAIANSHECQDRLKLLFSVPDKAS